MREYTCPKCGEEVGMMGHGPQPCLGRLSPKATESGRLRIELRAAQQTALCPFCRANFWRESGTKGRLVCNCGAQALDGRPTVAVKIE